MYFVDNVDLVPRRIGREEDLVLYLAHVVHACIGGAVDFDHVQRGAAGNLFGTIIVVARLGAWSVGTVERLCEDARRGSLTNPTGTGEEKSVGDAPRLYALLERRNDKFLADQLVECAGTTASGSYLVAHMQKKPLRLNSSDLRHNCRSLTAASFRT